MCRVSAAQRIPELWHPVLYGLPSQPIFPEVRFHHPIFSEVSPATKNTGPVVNHEEFDISDHQKQNHFPGEIQTKHMLTSIIWGSQHISKYSFDSFKNCKNEHWDSQ